MEVPISDEQYLVSQAQKLRSTDCASAKAWLITAKTLYPTNFSILFEAYKLERDANNLEEAAKCFSNIALTFQNQNVELWKEINELTNALRAPENEITPAQEFYVKMFQHVSYDVQHKILLLTVNNTENSIHQCKLLLLILKRFPQAAITHSPRLLEMIADGMKQNPQKYQEMLVEEALPLIYHKTPELPPVLVCRLFTISLEYYIRQIIDDETKCDINETWKKIFQVLMLCGKILRWETFLPFNKTWGQNVYWDKLIEIVSISQAGSTQVLFYATTLFIYSLHCYIKNCYTRAEDTDINHVLVEGFTVDWKVEASDVQSMEPPQISLTTPTSKDISKAFVHAAQCWQLLNTEQFQRDFSKLLLTLPLAAWISRFLFDLAIYFGHQEEAKKLMSEMMVTSNLVQNLQLLSLNLLQGNLTLQGFECIVKIIGELPTTQGHILEHLTLKVPRHMIFIPLTQKALVQYCTKAIVNMLSRKLYEPNCPDQILGDLLVLLQLEYPRETLMAEQIFALITTRGSFAYRLFTTYIVTIDFIEEFMHIWNANNENFAFDLSLTQGGSSICRVGTRGADKGAREDFRLIVKQQITRANETLTTLTANFIAQEHMQLVQNMFGVTVTGEGF
ncbi:integrator complex subunit 10 [Anastrepha obliqua]|uniref:integrator complex subunit 10 n=1 Tax=Anastrepha ludens TaxID=28586 RepID=UPI0023B1B6D2|nr:integrator complex subunit 10 [Anastrepha ludens]XP_054731502.1 integrator complex subunit 10 [Anastrepha obliqua]